MWKVSSGLRFIDHKVSLVMQVWGVSLCVVLSSAASESTLGVFGLVPLGEVSLEMSLSWG